MLSFSSCCRFCVLNVVNVAKCTVLLNRMSLSEVTVQLIAVLFDA